MTQTTLYIAYCQVDDQQNELNNQYLGYSADLKQVLDFIKSKENTEKLIREAGVVINKFHHDYPHYQRALSAENFAEAVRTGTMDSIVQEWKTAEEEYQKLNIPKDITDRIYTATPLHNFGYKEIVFDGVNPVERLWLLDTFRHMVKVTTTVYTDESEAKLVQAEGTNFHAVLVQYRTALRCLRNGFGGFVKTLLRYNLPMEKEYGDSESLFPNIIKQLPLPEEVAKTLIEEGVHGFRTAVPETYTLAFVDHI